MISMNWRNKIATIIRSRVSFTLPIKLVQLCSVDPTALILYGINSTWASQSSVCFQPIIEKLFYFGIIATFVLLSNLWHTDFLHVHLLHILSSCTFISHSYNLAYFHATMTHHHCNIPEQSNQRSHVHMCRWLTITLFGVYKQSLKLPFLNKHLLKCDKSLNVTRFWKTNQVITFGTLLDYFEATVVPLC